MVVKSVAETPPQRQTPPQQPRQRGRAVVGGVEYVVGGWGDFEIERRRARYRAGAPGSRACDRYEGRTRVGASDAVESILRAARPTSALQRAATRLADTLSRAEERLCDSAGDGVWECLDSFDSDHLTIPPITSADLLGFARTAADPDAMRDLSEDVTALVAALTKEVLPPLPELDARFPLPSRVVPVGDEEGVLRLEAAVAPFVATVEDQRAALAVRLDAADAAIKKALAARRR